MTTTSSAVSNLWTSVVLSRWYEFNASCIFIPGLNSLVYTHLWAALLFGLSVLYYNQEQLHDGRVRLGAALGLLSLPGLFVAMKEGGMYQLLFHFEYVAIVVAGMTKSHRFTTIWGAVGVTLAMLYMLSGFQALMNIFIGLLVILTVIYVIWRTSKKESPPVK